MNRFRKWILIAGLVLAGQACAADSGPPEKYTGTVVDEQGRSVAGASVDCYHSQSPADFGEMDRDREPEFAEHTVTDSNGAFAVSSAPGTTLAVVKKAGFATGWKTWSSQVAGSSDPVVLTEPTALAGVVVDENRQPVAGAEVSVAGGIIGIHYYGRAGPENQLLGKPAHASFSARTGADGRFRIENFPADGLAALAVSKTGKAQRRNDIQPLGPREYPSEDNDIELMVWPAGDVEGKVVVAETDQPLGGVSIRLEPVRAPGSYVYDTDFREAADTVETVGTAESSANGAFRISDVQPGKYRVIASIPDRPLPDWVVAGSTPVTVAAGETARDVVIHATKGALVEVAVVQTNGLTKELTPLAGAAVRLEASALGWIESTAYTDAGGVARMRLPTGKNWFSARKDWRSQHITAELEAGLTNHVRIVLTPPPRIAGTVRDPSGAPAAGVLVYFHAGIYPDAPDDSEVTTDKDGRYEMPLKLSREAVGIVDMVVSPVNFVLARSLERNLAAIQEFGDIGTIGQFPSNLDLILQPGITFSGLVQDTDGAPVTNATVDLSIQRGRFSLPLTKVNEQGSFTIPALPQGRDYFIWGGVAAKGYGTAGRDGDSPRTFQTRTDHYEFPPFVLKRANRKLAGQVLDPDEKPVAGITVNIAGAGQLPERSTRSSSNGHFAFDSVCEGPVIVSLNYKDHQFNTPAKGGDMDVVVKVGAQNGGPNPGTGGAGQAPTNRPPLSVPSQP